MVDEYPSNSHRDREGATPAKKTAAKAVPVKNIEQITTGSVKQRKRPLGTRFKEAFLGENGARGVWGFVTEQVLIPAAKDMIADATTQAVERTIFGESRSRSRGGFRPGGGPTRYDGRYSPAGAVSRPAPWQQDRPREISTRSRASHEFNEIILESRGEAEQVLDTLYDVINEYHQATVSDLYGLVGITAAYTDQKYGWTSLQGSGVSHVRGGGYLLDLPRPVPID